MAQATCTRCDRPLRPRQGAHGLCAPCYSTWYRARHGRKRHAATCTVCGAAFDATTPDARYCSTGVDSCEAKGKRNDDAWFDRWVADLTRDSTARDVRAYSRAMKADPCAYCGTSRSDVLDHIVPRNSGGEDHWLNYVGACRICNNSKWKLPLLLYLAIKAAERAWEPWRELNSDLRNTLPVSRAPLPLPGDPL